MMKPLASMLVLCLSLSITKAQDLKKLKDYAPDQSLLDAKPLTNGAFNQSIYNHFSYTILGSQSPTTGFKVETENPSISLKGRILGKKSSWFISTLELQAGVDGKLFQVFSEDQLSTHFKASLGLNFLLPKGYFNYIPSSISGANKYFRAAYRKMAIEKYEALVQQDKSTKIMTEMLGEKFLDEPTKKKLASLLTADSITDDELEQHVKSMLTLMKTDYTGIPIDAALSEFAKKWKDTIGHMALKEQFIIKHKKEIQLQKRSVDSLYNYEIANISEVWTRKFITWISLTPFVSNTNFMYYDPSPKTLDDQHSLLWGARLSANFFWKHKSPNQFHYLSVGVAQQRMNSLAEMTKYTYKKTDSKPILPDPDAPAGQTVAMAKEEVGTAYEGLYQAGPGTEIFIEGYSVPWPNGLAPGFYLKFNYTYSKLEISLKLTTPFRFKLTTYSA